MAILSEIDIISGLDLQLSHMWDFVLIDNPFDISSLASLTPSLGTDVAMKFKITSTSLPQPSLETESTKSGKKPYISRKYEDEYTITVLEDTSFNSYNYFRSWMNKVYDFDRNVWWHGDHSRAGLLFYYTSVPGIPSAIFSYEGIKIKNIGEIQNSRSSEGPLSLTITLSVEKVVPITVTGALGSSINAARLGLSALGINI